MLHTIGFALEPQERDSSDRVPVAATLLVDGVPAMKSPGGYFDLGVVLAYGARPAPAVYPFTCSCGVPGCAGFHREAVFEARGDEMVWLLPDDPFRTALRADLTDSSAPLELRFARAQYEAALETVTCELEAIAKRAAAPVTLDLSNDEADTSWYGRRAAPLSVRKQIQADRKRRLADDERQAWRERVWGKLLDEELIITMPNGFIYSLPLENLGDALVDQAGVSNKKRLGHLEREIVPSLARGLDAVIAAVKTLSWPWLEIQLFRHASCPKDLDDTAYAGMSAWPDVQFSMGKSTGAF